MKAIWWQRNKDMVILKKIKALYRMIQEYCFYTDYTEIVTYGR